MTQLTETTESSLQGSEIFICSNQIFNRNTLVKWQSFVEPNATFQFLDTKRGFINNLPSHTHSTVEFQCNDASVCFEENKLFHG